MTEIGLPRLSTGPVCSDQVSEKIPALGDLKVKGNSILCPGRSTPVEMINKKRWLRQMREEGREWGEKGGREGGREEE